METSIADVEKSVDAVMHLYSQQIRAGSPRSSTLAKERDELYERSYNWLMVAKHRNWSCVQDPPPAPPPPAGTGGLERVKLPFFTGRPEDWADFRREFQEMVRAANYSPVLEMKVLRDHLKEESRAYITGVTVPAEAWELLNKKYGDRTLAMLTTRHRLVSLKLPRGAPHDQLEALVQGVRHAKTCLRAVQAEDTLFSDLTIIGTLLMKLPQMHQQRWYYYRSALPPSSSPVEDGKLFEQWLEVEGEAATLARLTTLGMELGRASAAPPPVDKSCEQQKSHLAP